MSRPTLYLMLGYPGSGKTTTAKIIHELTGAVHLWADRERTSLYGEPTHTHDENLHLYGLLNDETAQLLSLGHSVVFDTGFNFFADREHLREIAEAHNADCLVLWLTTHKHLAKERAIHNEHSATNGYPKLMKETDFERISRNLEPPQESEHYIELDGTKISSQYVAKRLGIANEPAES